MEAILNLLWLAVALGLIGLWRFRWLVSRRIPRAGVLPEIVAIGCAISLLLPAISLTDDLHPEIVAVDAASGKRNSCLLAVDAAGARHATPASSFQSILAILPAPLAHVELKIAGINLPTEDLESPALSGSYLGRSPPSLR
jgi:hypothetical protein